MVIDLSRVCYLVSSSLDLIISTSRQLDYKGGKLCLYCALGGVKTVLKAAQIDTQIDVYCTREEAVAACLG
jgi:anti-anti-sigma factor